MASPVIELQSVTMQFGNETILSQINLTVQKSEVFVLVGPSGHGKSTLLKIVAGILPPTEGIVKINGQDFYRQSALAQDSIRKKMGMLFQKNALFDSMSVAENVAFPLKETTNFSEDKIINNVNHFLEAVGITHARDLAPSDISGGMQKRLGIARALALSPEVVLYDDPTAGLDPITSKKIVDLILKLNRDNGSTVIAITNEMNRAYQLADRIGMLVDGQLIITGNEKQTREHIDPRVQQFIFGKLAGPLTEMA